MGKPRKKKSNSVKFKYEVLPTIVLDFSEGIEDISKWTRGPAIPVYADADVAKNGKPKAKRRSKGA